VTIERAEAKSRPQSKLGGTVGEIALLALVAVVVALVVKTFVAQAFYIPSRSMEPQLKVNDRVVVSKLAYRLHPPRRGDIIVFDAPPSEQQPQSGNRNAVVRALRTVGEAIGVIQARTEFIKRVIALPGETVEGRGGHVYVNGQYLYEPYLASGLQTSTFAPVTIKPGFLWVMGDNRDDSRDSRFFGAIPRSKVVGRTIWRIWPPGRTSFL
jgi:signal peptidase I